MGDVTYPYQKLLPSKHGENTKTLTEFFVCPVPSSCSNSQDFVCNSVIILSSAIVMFSNSCRECLIRVLRAFADDVDWRSMVTVYG